MNRRARHDFEGFFLSCRTNIAHPFRGAKCLHGHIEGVLKKSVEIGKVRSVRYTFSLPDFHNHDIPPNLDPARRSTPNDA